LLKEKKGNEFLLSLIRKYGTLTALVAVICVFSLLEPRFFSLTNFFNITRQITVLFVLGVAETYALISGEIDLSIGWVAGLAGILAVAAQAEGCSTLMAISIALAVGLLFGLCNGFIIAIIGIESFIATLGLGQIANGLIFLYTKGAPVIGLRESFMFLAAGKILGIPVPLLIILVIFLIADYHLKYTSSGRFFYAIGYNPEASLMSGLNVKNLKILSFAITGLLSGMGGVVIMARLGSGQPTAGPGYLLNAIAVAYLGASVLKEGEFHILGTLVGAVFIGTIINGLTILNVQYYYQFVATGLLLLIAVGLASMGKKSAKS